MVGLVRNEVHKNNWINLHIKQNEKKKIEMVYILSIEHQNHSWKGEMDC